MTVQRLLKLTGCQGSRWPLWIDSWTPRVWVPDVVASRGLSSALDKTLALFQARLVLPLARTQLDPNAFDEWFAHACSVQQAIYEIDHYYERSALIENDTEAALWKDVDRHVASGAAVPGALVFSALHDLRCYAEAELRLHVLDPIDPREFDTILRLKCSDVRMARGLIWSYGRHVPGVSECRFWSLYDQCWELIEDLEDLDEDGRDWNFNFWLYLFMSGRSAPIGVDSAARLLRRKLAELEDAGNRVPTGIRSLCQAALTRTLSAGEAAERLRGLALKAITNGHVVPFAQQLPHARPRSVPTQGVSILDWTQSDG